MEEQIKLLKKVNEQLRFQLEAQGELIRTMTLQLRIQAEQLEKQSAKIDELLKKIEELTHKKNSRNSSAPPSTDGYAKPAPKSQRKSSGAKPGGQDGHKGSSMKLMKAPDEIREHYPQACSGCPNREHCHGHIVERRYESDIIVESRLIEHRQIVCCCPMAANKTLIGEFPKNITGTKQYGNNLKAFAAALSTVGMVGIDRIHELLTGVFDISVSTGSIQNWITQLSSATKDAVQQIRERVSCLRVLNCDETGLRVNGSLHWLHCLCNEKWSYLVLHKKRGRKAMDEIDILPEFHNTMVHDFWKPYYKYSQAVHGICNAHIMRELVYAQEQKHQNWAKSMQDLLIEIHESRNILMSQKETGFQALVLEAYHVRYDAIVQLGIADNIPPQKPKGKRGRVGKGKILCLLERLRDYKEDILRFAADWTVPFTNNEAERTIRFSKVKQKVSGCFRTEKGAQDYMRIMSFVSTARKHGMSYFEAVRAALEGNALTLVTQWG